MLYGADSGWWMQYAGEARDFPGLKVTASVAVAMADVLSLRPSGVEGFDPDPRFLRTGRNSAYQVTHIAAQAGAARILLCGVDMHNRGGSHHHGDHPAPLRNTTDRSFARMLEAWSTIVEPLKALGVEVINCSPGSALECFPNRAIEDVL